MDGLSTRDWFAGQAVVALLNGIDQERYTPDFAQVAKDAYRIADKLMEERMDPEYRKHSGTA